MIWFVSLLKYSFNLAQPCPSQGSLKDHRKHFCSLLRLNFHLLPTMQRLKSRSTSAVHTTRLFLAVSLAVGLVVRTRRLGTCWLTSHWQFLMSNPIGCPWSQILLTVASVTCDLSPSAPHSTRIRPDYMFEKTLPTLQGFVRVLRPPTLHDNQRVKEWSNLTMVPLKQREKRHICRSSVCEYSEYHQLDFVDE